MHPYVSPQFADLDEKARELAPKYRTAEPFPHVVIDGFFEDAGLDAALAEFPDLSARESIRFESPKEIKLASSGDAQLTPNVRGLLRALNAEPFLKFLQQLTGIEETLLPDPYFYGGGMHQIKRGGLLKVHADFAKHEVTGLDRRVNVLIYLNKEWDEAFGGCLELWDRKMQSSEQRIHPLFNRMVVFSTTPTAFHGHPDALACPPERSRKSLALYYYTNGRPAAEVVSDKPHSTRFQVRKGDAEDLRAVYGNRGWLSRTAHRWLPPAALSALRKLVSRGR